MTRAAVFACGLLWAVQPGFAHNEPGRSVQDTTIAVDTLTHQEMSVESKRHQDSTVNVEKTFPRPTKLPIIEEHIFDVGTQPVNIGEKEIRAVPLGKRWETEFVGKPATMNGKVTAGYGNYTTPRMHAWIGSASTNREFLIRAMFRSSEGPGQNRDVRSGVGAVAASWYLSERAGMFVNGRARTSVEAHADRYRLYGSTSPSQARLRSLLQGELMLSSVETGQRNARLVFTGVRIDDARRAEEVSLGARIAVAESVHRTIVSGEVNLWKDFQTHLMGLNPFFSSLTVRVQSRLAGALAVTGGANVHYIENPSDPLRWRILPHASIVWSPAEALSLFATYDPFVQRRTLSGFVQENPFVRSALAVRTTDVVVNATGGLAADVAGVVKARAAFNYQRVHGYPIFSYTAERMWEVTYASTTTIASLESELYVERGASLVGVKLSLTKSKTEASSTGSVPYLPEVSLTASAQHAFPIGLRVASVVRYTGRRVADVQNTRSLHPYLLWDARAEFGERILVGAEVTNILDRREGVWEGYAGEPRRVMLSLGYTW